MPKTINAWSFSRWNTYQKCPRQAFYRFLQKLPEPEAPPLVRGKEIHQESEDYLNGKLAEVPASLAAFRAEYEELRERDDRVTAEEGLTFNRRWEPIHEDIPRYFNPSTWLRVKVDILEREGEHARVVDVKTGKVREAEHTPQLELYAPAVFLQYPSVQTLDAELWYVDQEDILSETYDRDEVPDLIREWEERVAPMLTDATFEPRPDHPKCKFCPFSHRFGNGPCEAG